MKKCLNVAMVLSIALSVFTGCAEEEDYGTGIRPDGPSYVPKDCVFTTRGFLDSSSDGADRYPSFT